MQYQSKINNILADVIRGTRNEIQYTITDANYDIHNIFNGKVTPEILEKTSTIDYLINESCSVFGIQDREEIFSPSRKRARVLARQTCMYLLDKYRAGTLEQIGRMFGGRDHSTVIHSKNAIQNIIDVEDAFYDKVALVEERLVEYMNSSNKAINVTELTPPKPPFNIHLLVEKINQIRHKQLFSVDPELIKSSKIEKGTCDIILSLIKEISNEQEATILPS
jgi:hypothetical protein